MPAEKVTRRKFLQRSALTVGALSGYAGVIEPEWLEVTRTDIPIKGLGKGLDGFKIGLIADLHIPTFIDVAFVRRAFDLAMAEKVDLLTLPGDIFQRDTDTTKHNLAPFFEGYKPEYGFLGSLGNHDILCQHERLIRQVEDTTPIKMLVNQHEMIERDGAKLAIGGLPMLGFNPKIDVRKTFAGVPNSVPRIALCHHPDFAEKGDRAQGRIDLLLSGHTHGGQIKLLPNYAPVTQSKFGNKFREGLVEGKAYRVYVTRGLARVFHCRLMARPEVSILTLRSAPT